MTRTTLPLLALAVGAAIVSTAACGTSASTSAPTVAATTTSAAPPVVKVGNTKIGRVIVNAAGFTVYVTDNNPYGFADCNTYPCGLVYFGLTVKGTSVAVGPGLKASMFRTVPGPKGTRVVAVNGRALYRSTKDKVPGQINGSDALWHPVGPDGLAVMKG